MLIKKKKSIKSNSCNEEIEFCLKTFVGENFCAYRMLWNPIDSYWISTTPDSYQETLCKLPKYDSLICNLILGKYSLPNCGVLFRGFNWYEQLPGYGCHSPVNFP